MKKMREMESNLQSKGFTFNEEDSEWTKDIWTIRFLGNEVEAYHTPLIDGYSKYYVAAATPEVLSDILDEL